MQKVTTYLQRYLLLLLLLISSAMCYAQLTAKVGETTVLSVSEVPNGAYAWELYDQYEGIDFAKIAGNCPTEKAYFVSGNQGNSVQVKWLQSGTYFYKVTISDGCSNNLKIGKITIISSEMPPPPKILVTYHCDEETATLKAVDYQGDLLWSTGETSDTIEVSTKGTYSVTQTVYNQQSNPSSVSITSIKPPNAPDTSSSSTHIELGQNATLVAEGCNDGTLVWYKDEDLTEEVESTNVSPSEGGTYTYYAVCKNDNGCESPYATLVLTVDACPIMYSTIKIPQGISPNGDGKNDVWNIENLRSYCKKCSKKAKVVIFNRLGAKVYEQDNYMLNDARFTGKSNHQLTIQKGEKLPVGVYFFIIEFDDGKTIQDYLYINY